MTTPESSPARARLIDPGRSGPWALTTGASAGIGTEFAHQLGAHGLNLLDLAHHFGQRLAARKRGGLVLVGALGASPGVPFMANAAATKETLIALNRNRARVVRGRLLRLLFGLIPASVTRSRTAKMFQAALKPKPSA